MKVAAEEKLDRCYMQARWYDPGSGRFLSIDPLHFRVAGRGSVNTDLGAVFDGRLKLSKSISLLDVIHTPQHLNAYGYATNNPINAVDPVGEVAILAGLTIVVVSGAVGAAIAVGSGGDPVIGAVVAGIGAALRVVVSAAVGATALTGAAAVGRKCGGIRAGYRRRSGDWRHLFYACQSRRYIHCGGIGGPATEPLEKEAF